MKGSGKKILSGLLACILAGFPLTACGNPGNTPGSGDGSTPAVTFTMFQFKVEAKDAFQKAVDAYQKEHPNVTIHMETVGAGGGDYSASLKTKMKSDPPVIFNYSGPQDMKDWESKLEDLSDQPWVKHISKSSIVDVTKDNKIYGMPFDLEGYGFVINRKIFEDAGISFDSMLTFEGMKKGFDTLKTKIDSGAMKEKYPHLEAVMELPAKETWVIGNHNVNPILAQEFGSATDAFNSPTLTFKASDAYKKMIDFQVSYTKNAKNAGALNSVDYSTSLEGGLAIERVAAIQQGNWIAPSVANTDESVLEKLDMLPYPVPGYSDGKYFTGVPEYWAVNKDSPDDQKKSAKDFLNWLYQSETGKKIIIEDAKFAVPYDNYDGLKAGDPLTQRVMNEQTKGNVQPGWVFGGAPATWATQVAAVNVQKYLAGDATWEQAVKDCKDQWTAMRKS